VSQNAFLGALKISNTIKIKKNGIVLYEEPLCDSTDLTYRGKTAQTIWDQFTIDSQKGVASTYFYGNFNLSLPEDLATESKSFYESIEWVK
jgi:hypothetical protein